MEKMVYDPRGAQRAADLVLARRPASLAGRRVLFFDNTKLALGRYGVIRDVVRESLENWGVDDVQEMRRTMRGQNLTSIRALVAEIKTSTRAEGAVLAVADMGVTPATTLLAVELERAGVPTALITAGPGRALAEAVAAYRAEALALCPLDLYHGSTAEEVRRETEGQLERLRGALTWPPERLRAEFALNRLLDREPPAEARTVTLPADMPPDEAFAAWLGEMRLGDGLPVVLPTPERVERMLAYAPGRAGEVLMAEAGPAGSDLTVRDVAVNAVMAGCEGRLLPILLAALKGMLSPAYSFLQSITTSHPGGNLVMVSGPLAAEAGIHAGQGCLGSGFAANAALGRAVNLVILNVCRAVPGVADLGCLGSPAEFTYCFAEAAEHCPWEPFHAFHADEGATTVLVMKAEPPHDVIEFVSDRGEDLLAVVAGTCTGLGSNNAYLPSSLVVVLVPDHARILAREGWTRRRVQEFIFEHAANPRARTLGRGIAPIRPAGFDEREKIPVARSPEDIHVVVAGGAGPHSAVILPWGLYSEAVVERVLLPDGRVPASLEDFRALSR